MNIAKIISGIAHPILTPLYCLFIIFHSGTFFDFYPHSVIKIIYSVVFVSTIILPLAILPLLKSNNIITSYHLIDKSERVFPLLFSIMFYLLGFFILNKMPTGKLFPNLMLASIISIAIFALISIKWKISLHMAAIGGIIGFILAFAHRYSVDLSAFFIIAISLAGLLAFARLKLQMHNQVQVYIGFFAGAILMFTLLLNL